MATDCGGSWEESPPSLIDVAIRDRRWAQGNLQHMKIIGAAGLSFTSRLHLGVGIMSYLSSPLWLVMLGIGFALAVQSHLIRPEYFSHDFQLFPDLAAVRRRADDDAVLVQHGGAADSEDARPDSRAAVDARIRRGGGGVIGITASFLLEVILSALYAPMLMLIQCRHVFEVFMGRDSGWKPQRRDGGGTSWADAWRFHQRHMLLSCVTAVIVWFLSPPLLAWVSPALLGLFLAVPLSRASGSECLGTRPVAPRAAAHARGDASRRRWWRAARELIAQAQPLPADGLQVIWRAIAKRASRTSTAICRGPRIRAVIPIRMPSPREQKLKDARLAGRSPAMADAGRARRSRRRCALAQSARAAAGCAAPLVLDLKDLKTNDSPTRTS